MKTNFHHYPNTPISANKSVNNPAAALKGSKSKFAETFRQTLQQTNSPLTISKHAQMRMQQRNIDIDDEAAAQIFTNINGTIIM